MLEIPNSAEKLKRLALDPSVFSSVEGDEKEKATRKRGKAAANKKKPKAKKSYSFLLCVVLPALLGAMYYMLLASDQYAAQSRFAIRGSDSGAGGADLLGLITGVGGSTPTSGDAYIVTEYIYSRELVEDLDKKINLRKIYSRDEADFFASFNPNDSIEDFVEYWKSMVTVYFNVTGGIVELEVRAFTAEDAKVVSQNVIGMSEKLINELSRKVRDDAVREAKSEVARAENRLRLARSAIAGFRETSQIVDPSLVARSEHEIISKLEGELTRRQTDLNVVKNTMSDTAPRVIYLRTQIGALEKQIGDERTKIALRKRDGSGGTLSKQLKAYEELVTEREFAEKAFVSTLASLERARIDADRQQRYITVFVNPRTPEEALYPERLRWTLIVFGSAFLLWGIGSLAVSSIRDHMI